MKKIISSYILPIFMAIFLCLVFQYLDFYIVCSGSMENEILTGSIVIVNSKDIDAEVGDIITFTCGQDLVTHRVVAIEQDTFRTKGDANQDLDPNPVTKEQIKGIVIGDIPYLGYLIFCLKKNYRITIIGICMILGICIYLGWRRLPPL